MGAGRQAAPPHPFQTDLTPPGLETPVNLTDGVISSGESRGWARSGRGAQRPASAFHWTPTMTKEQKIIRAKVGLLELAKQLGNVSQACISRDGSKMGQFQPAPEIDSGFR